MLGPIWPALFVFIACGACSGFHSLCAGGTTCKQLTDEAAARRVFQSVERYLTERLKLQLNRGKSRVCRTDGVEFVSVAHEVRQEIWRGGQRIDASVHARDDGSAPPRLLRERFALVSCLTKEFFAVAHSRDDTAWTMRLVPSAEELRSGRRGCRRSFESEQGLLVAELLKAGLRLEPEPSGERQRRHLGRLGHGNE